MHLTRDMVRYFGAAAAGIMAFIYFLIGFSVLDIGGTTTGEATDQFMFGVAAGIAFLLLAALLLFTDLRWLWVASTILLSLVFVAYVGASAIRDPAFEVWGMTLRLIQLPLMAAVLYLAIKPVSRKVIS